MAEGADREKRAGGEEEVWKPEMNASCAVGVFTVCAATQAERFADEELGK